MDEQLSQALRHAKAAPTDDGAVLTWLRLALRAGFFHVGPVDPFPESLWAAALLGSRPALEALGVDPNKHFVPSGDPCAHARTPSGDRTCWECADFFEVLGAQEGFGALLWERSRFLPRVVRALAEATFGPWCVRTYGADLRKQPCGDARCCAPVSRGRWVSPCPKIRQEAMILAQFKNLATWDPGNARALWHALAIALPSRQWLRELVFLRCEEPLALTRAGAVLAHAARSCADTVGFSPGWEAVHEAIRAEFLPGLLFEAE